MATKNDLGQIHSGTTAELALENPVLPPGVIGLATDTLVTKRGDGVTEWDDLPTDGRGIVVQGFTSAAIQAAIDASYPSAQRVVMPVGRYLLTEPIKVRRNGLSLLGEGRKLFDDGGVTLIPSGFNGPLIHIRPYSDPISDLPFTTALVGTGNALALDPAATFTDTYLDLQDAVAANVDGLEALTIEFFFRLDSEAGGFQRQIMGSYGSLSTNITPTSAYEFYTVEGGDLRATLNVDGVTKTVSTGASAIAFDTVYHVALTYDGSNVKLWVSGVLKDTEAATGPIRQRFSEMGYIGTRRLLWPKGAPWTNCIEGAIDSIRFSSTARYTTGFTAPTAKLAFDGSTMLLENFDNETIDWSIVQTNSGPTYLLKHSSFNGHLISHLEFGNFEMIPGRGHGIWAKCAIESYYHDLFVWQGVFAFNLWNNNFLSRFERVGCVAYTWSKLGYLLTGAGGLSSFRDISANGYAVNLLTENSSGTLQNLFFHGAPIFHIVLRGSSFTVQDCGLANEDASAELFEANLVLIDCPVTTLISGGFERYVNAGPAIIVAGGQNISIITTAFEMHEDATEVIEFVAPLPEKEVVILNGSWGRASFPRDIPWTTTMGAVVEVP